VSGIRDVNVPVTNMVLRVHFSGAKTSCSKLLTFLKGFVPLLFPLVLSNFHLPIRFWDLTKCHPLSVPLRYLALNHILLRLNLILARNRSPCYTIGLHYHYLPYQYLPLGTPNVAERLATPSWTHQLLHVLSHLHPQILQETPPLCSRV
jgi:hypothetical protein